VLHKTKFNQHQQKSGNPDSRRGISSHRKQ